MQVLVARNKNLYWCKKLNKNIKSILPHLIREDHEFNQPVIQWATMSEFNHLSEARNVKTKTKNQRH